MNTKWMRYAGFTGAVVLAAAAWAQSELLPPPGPDKLFFFKTTSERGGMEVKPIKGAPYSADQTTTTTQTLADGNRIIQTSAAKVYRDDQGRSRVEQSLGSIGTLPSTEKHTMIMINDPVAGVRYSVQPENRTAQKIPTIVEDVGLSETKVETGMAAKKQAERAAQPTNQIFFSAGGTGSDTSMGTVTYKYDVQMDAKKNGEDLGTQTLEGLKVTGTRTTVTIPVGAEGNEQPMQIVDERWYSPDLQTNIKTIHSDPRMGQTVFTVTNVTRAIPDASLFQLPAGYQMTEGEPVHTMILHSSAPPTN